MAEAAAGESTTRQRPHVLCTGTPGCGKTSLASLIAERLDNFKHVDVAAIIEQHKCYDGRDEALDTNVLDEDKLLDILEPIFEQADSEKISIVADFHVCEIFPERFFNLVLVLRTKTEILFDRLTERGYNDKKRDENMQSEIMQVILEEAREAYDQAIVHEVQSNDMADMESNAQRVKDWTSQWILDQGFDADKGD